MRAARPGLGQEKRFVSQKKGGGNTERRSMVANVICSKPNTSPNLLSMLAAALVVAIAHPPTPPLTGCTLLTLFSYPTGRGIVACLAPLLGQLQRSDEPVLVQHAVAVGVGGLPDIAQVGGTQAAAAQQRFTNGFW